MPCKKLLSLLFCVCILSGCEKTGAPMQHALDFRTALTEAGGCSYTAAVTASYEDRVYDFSLSCQYQDGETELEVLEPKSIAGITASVARDGAELEFDGALLEFGKMANGYVAPVAVPWLLCQCWAGEYIAYAGPDGDLERVTYLRGYNDAELSVDTWFSGGVPLHAEVIWDGVRCLTVEISNFSMHGGTLPTTR